MKIKLIKVRGLKDHKHRFKDRVLLELKIK